MTVVAGVDAGGTKTDVLVVGRDGTVKGQARGGGANHETAGFEAAEAVLRATLAEALAAAGARPTDLAASAWGLAGLDWPSDEVAYRALLARLGLPGPLVVVNDVFVALRAGVPQGEGIVVVAGTGVVAAGRDRDGRTWRTLGIGSGPGDWGSGPEIVREAANAVALASMGLGPVTALTALSLERSGAGSVPEFLEGVLRWRRPGLSPADVWDAAAEGDEVADRLADRVAGSIATAAAGVARRLDLDGPDVVLAGRVLDPGHPLLHERVAARIAAALPGARTRRLGRPPVVGAALEAAAAAGWRLTALLDP